MAGRSDTRIYDALLSTTLEVNKKRLTDNIFDVFPLLSWMNGKLGRTMGVKNGQGSIKRIENGGESITEPLLYAVNSTAKSYSGLISSPFGFAY